VVVIPGDEVARLVQRFGSKVREMGVWNKTIDGSVEVPMNNITETAATLENRVLAEAVEQLKSPEQFDKYSVFERRGRLRNVVHGDGRDARKPSTCRSSRTVEISRTIRQHAQQFIGCGSVD